MRFENPLFAPKARATWSATTTDGKAHEEPTAYAFLDDRVIAAVNVAMAAKRPLLVTGPPGGGKSSLARAIAGELKWAYVEQTITSRTELADLTVGVDAVARLADAQIGPVKDDWAYLKPGVLWWAFDAPLARTRGGHPVTDDLRPLSDPRDGIKADEKANVVVLLDEIDKAEPDLPNDLLVPLDRFGFDVPEIGSIQAEHDVFVVITSNGERRLPPAFLRRCVQLEVDPTSETFFVAVAEAHFGTRDDTRYLDIAKQFLRYRQAAVDRNRREPSTAEYLDTVRACLQFDTDPGSDQWLAIVESALWKAKDLPEEIAVEQAAAAT